MHALSPRSGRGAAASRVFRHLGRNGWRFQWGSPLLSWAAVQLSMARAPVYSVFFFPLPVKRVKPDCNGGTMAVARIVAFQTIY